MSAGHDLGTETGAAQASEVTVASHPVSAPGGLQVLVPGVSWAAAVAAFATLLGGLAPVVGARVFAVLGGIAIAVVRKPAARFRPGLAFTAKKVLQGSIVLMGLGLSLGQVLSTGVRSLPVLLPPRLLPALVRPVGRNGHQRHVLGGGGVHRLRPRGRLVRGHRQAQPRTTDSGHADVGSPLLMPPGIRLTAACRGSPDARHQPVPAAYIMTMRGNGGARNPRAGRTGCALSRRRGQGRSGVATWPRSRHRQ